MIRVNLIGKVTTNAAGNLNIKEDGLESNPKERNKAAVHFIAILLFPVGLYMYEFSVVPPLEKEKRTIQAELDEARAFNVQYQALSEELKRFEEDRQKLNAQIGAVEALSVDRLKVVRALDALQTLIPEKAWLLKVSYDYDKSTLIVEGLAVGDPDVTGFLDALSKSIYFGQVNLRRSQEQLLPDDKMGKRFEIGLTMEQAKWPQK
ncbi:MAG: PilN domain-containing protein [Pseudobdellovibrionaceae bacterium]